MISISVCLCLLGLCFFVKRCLSVSIERIPFLVLSIAILVLYAFAYASHLEMGVWILLVTGGASFLIMCPYLAKLEYEQRMSYFTPGFVFWLILTTLCACFFSFSSLTVWDEFMHWAPLSKVMSVRVDMLYGDYQVVHQAYPPGARLFYMLFFLPAGFDEGRAYIAQTIILASPLAVLFRWRSWNRWRRAAILSVTIFLSIYFLVDSWVPVLALYMDLPVALFISFSFLSYYRSERKVLDILYLGPLLGALVLLKPQLLVFALLVLVLVMMDLLLRREVSFRAVVSVIFVFIFVALVNWSWHLHLSIHHIAEEWSQANMGNLLGMLRAVFDSRYSSVLPSLLNSLLSELPLLVMLVYLSILLPFLIPSRADRLSWWGVSFVWLIGLFFYLFSLVGYYMLVYEGGPYGYSLLRYSAVYLLAWTFFTVDEIFAWLYSLSLAISLHIKRLLFCLFYLGTILLIAFSLSKYFYELKQGVNSSHLNKQVESIAEQVKLLTPEKSKVFTVWQNSTGLGRTMMLYSLFPRGYNYLPTSFSEVKPGQVGWQADLSPAEFVLRLQGFDYLLLAHDDPFFWERYGQLIEGREPLLSYEYCEGVDFDMAMKPGCVLGVYQAYLFKVVHDGDRLHFINVLHGETE